MRLYLISAPALQSSYLDFLNEKNVGWNESNQHSISDAQRLVEFSGRICYMSFGDKQSPRTNPEYIANLINKAHESVLEHANFSILADGISRGLSHQLVRHRAGFSYSQLSQQYHDEASAIFVKPDGLENFPDLEKIWEAAVGQSLKGYKQLASELEKSDIGESLSNKERMRMIRSACRSVLPAATSTCLMVTANARAWRNLLSTRGAIEGDFEMLDFCANIFRILSSHSPALFSDFECLASTDGHSLIKQKIQNIP